VCQGYDYITDQKKLKIFPITLKGTTMGWFMFLGGKTISTWDEIKTSFQRSIRITANVEILRDF